MKESRTSAPPVTASPQSRPGKWSRCPRCASSSSREPTMSPTLTRTGASTGPIQGTGMRNKISHVSSDGGQPKKTHSQT